MPLDPDPVRLDDTDDTEAVDLAEHGAPARNPDARHRSLRAQDRSIAVFDQAIADAATDDERADLTAYADRLRATRKADAEALGQPEEP